MSAPNYPVSKGMAMNARTDSDPQREAFRSASWMGRPRDRRERLVSLLGIVSVYLMAWLIKPGKWFFSDYRGTLITLAMMMAAGGAFVVAFVLWQRNRTPTRRQPAASGG